MPTRNEFRRIPLRTAAALAALLAFAIPALAQDASAPYTDATYLLVYDAADTTLDVYTAVDPYGDDVVVTATFTDGPFAGMTVQGRAFVVSEHPFGANARLVAMFDSERGDLVLTAVLPNADSARGVRLAGRTSIFALSPEAAAALWPHVLTAMRTSQGAVR